MTTFRVEKDSMGEVQVPAQAYYGAQTQRAVENFPISGLTIHPWLVEALGSIKGAAAEVNGSMKVIDKKVAKAVSEAAAEVAAGLLHLQRRNLRGARNKLAEGLEKLGPYKPAHEGVFVIELRGEARRLLNDLEAGYLPYRIPPTIRFTDSVSPDFSR